MDFSAHLNPVPPPGTVGSRSWGRESPDRKCIRFLMDLGRILGAIRGPYEVLFRTGLVQILWYFTSCFYKRLPERLQTNFRDEKLAKVSILEGHGCG